MSLLYVYSRLMIFLDLIIHIALCALKKALRASYKDLNLCISSLIHLFILAQNFSMGFKSGEYAGKKIISHLTDSISFLAFSDLCNVSMITIVIHIEFGAQKLLQSTV